MGDNNINEKMKFSALWNLSLKLVTLFTAGFLSGMFIIGLLNIADKGAGWLFSMVILPVLIITGAAFVMIRGYELTKETLFIQRLFWKSRIQLTDLKEIQIDPEAMKKSVRTFGTGGLFSFSGRFRNKTLGQYHAFATAPDLAVILTFPDQIIVVTPDHPETFVRQIKGAGQKT